MHRSSVETCGSGVRGRVGSGRVAIPQAARGLNVNYQLGMWCSVFINDSADADAINVVIVICFRFVDGNRHVIGVLFELVLEFAVGHG